MAEDLQTVGSGIKEQANQSDKEKISLEKLRFTMDKRIDLAVSVTIVLLGVFVIVGARNIRAGSVPDPITSRGMPYVAGSFFVIGGIIVGVMQFKIWSALPGHLVPAEGRTDEEGHPASWVRAFSIVLVSLLWAWFLKPLGYLIATPLFVLVGSILLGLRSRAMIIGFPIIFSILTWYVFSQFFEIRLPLGPLMSFVRSLGLMP